MAQSHFTRLPHPQAVVRVLWIIGNFISNEVKGPASARIIPGTGAEEKQQLTQGWRIYLLQAAIKTEIIAYASPHCAGGKPGCGCVA